MLYILNLLVKFDYENTKLELVKLYKCNALEFLKVLHLYAKEKTSDWWDITQDLYYETYDSDPTGYMTLSEKIGTAGVIRTLAGIGSILYFSIYRGL